MAKKSHAGRNAAMVIGGVAAGIVGSRLLPPLIAAAGGMSRTRAGGDPFDRLIQDHRQILSTLDQMLAAPADSTFRRSRLYLMLKRKLAKHAMAEEDVVYPLVQRGSAQDNQSKHLYDEHADMKILLFQLEERLKAGTDWTDLVRPLRDLIHHHADEEENNVFPQLRRSLNESMLPKVSGQIQREEAMVL